MYPKEIKLRKEFGVYLRQKRIRRGLTQSDVSIHCELTSPQFISNIERGKCAIPPKLLAKLADIYKVRRKEMARRYNEISLKLLESCMEDCI